MDRSVVADAGTLVSFKVKATGKGKTYTWYFKNPGWKNWSKSDCTSSTYKTRLTDDRSGRQIFCVVRTEDGKKDTTQVVTMKVK